jgi:hypothetical protein
MTTINFGRARCPVCHRTVATHVPQGGDGSIEVFRRHRSERGGGICIMGRAEVRAEDRTGDRPT